RSPDPFEGLWRHCEQRAKQFVFPLVLGFCLDLVKLVGNIRLPATALAFRLLLARLLTRRGELGAQRLAALLSRILACLRDRPDSARAVQEEAHALQVGPRPRQPVLDY